jgi:phosphatidylinositol-3-phosphatase
MRVSARPHRRWRYGGAPAGLVLAALLLALGSAPAAAPAHGAPAASGGPCGTAAHAPRWQHVVVIAFENHSYRQILGRSAPASYFTTLAHECGQATSYRGLRFPSLPNYIAATSGQLSITRDCTPAPGCESGAPSIFGQVGSSHWQGLAQSMPHPCTLKNAGLYVPRHMPAAYYTRPKVRGACRARLVPLGSRPTLGAAFTWIAPDLRHDLHNGTIAQASAWLQGFLAGPNGVLHRRPYTDGRTAIFIWFDTPAGSQSIATPIPMIVVSPSTRPGTVATPSYTHYGALLTWERMLGRSCLAHACGARAFREAFHLR